MKILLTGFEPFDNSPINPSEQIIHALANEPTSSVQIESAVLPVDLKLGPAALLYAVKASEPEAIICLGQASHRSVISIERVAVNLLDFRMPDNAGNQVEDRPIKPNGPAAYFTTLPIRKISSALKANGIPAELSLSAGTYLCNQVIFTLLHYLKEQDRKIPAGFIHLPALPEQAAQMKGSVPSMSLETMLQGIRIAIQVVAEE
ncbi:MAG: pyroglutamyl-peptidase I [Anaerolineales bacterium]